MAVVLAEFCIVLLAGGGSAEADVIFGPPTNLGQPVNSSFSDQPAGITADGLALYFSSQRSGGYSEWYDIWVTRRPTIDDPWGEPANLGSAINTTRSEFEPDVSPDGLILVFTRAGTNPPDWDIWMATRPTRDDPWGMRQNLGPTINSPVEDMDPSISADGLTLYFNSRRSGGYGGMDVYMTTRSTRDDPWGEPVNLGPPVNTSYSDYGPEISADGRTLFFNPTRPGGLGDTDLYVTRRPTRNDPWSEPVNLGPVLNTVSFEDYPALPADERSLMFSCSRPDGVGGTDIWQAPIIPVVNFNGDAIVDIKDLLILIESWGQNDPSVDIGPTPLGDGVVDEADLEVLMSYWGQEPYDPTLIAHWKFDETEGIVASDSAGNCDGTVCGDPLWQPGGGAADGALALDGVGDFVAADFVLDPSKGPLSVFVWVKGGEPGQVILSQVDGKNWLCANPANGCLVTELRGLGRDSCTLCSETSITDGQWHHIGLIWDGANRSLYIDDTVVANDTQAGDLSGCFGGLNIGCDKNMAPGTFFAGLMDDLRIYSHAVIP